MNSDPPTRISTTSGGKKSIGDICPGNPVTLPDGKIVLGMKWTSMTFMLEDILYVYGHGEEIQKRGSSKAKSAYIQCIKSFKKALLSLPSFYISHWYDVDISLDSVKKMKEIVANADEALSIILDFMTIQRPFKLDPNTSKQSIKEYSTRISSLHETLVKRLRVSLPPLPSVAEYPYRELREKKEEVPFWLDMSRPSIIGSFLAIRSALLTNIWWGGEVDGLQNFLSSLTALKESLEKGVHVSINFERFRLLDIDAVKKLLEKVSRRGMTGQLEPFSVTQISKKEKKRFKLEVRQRTYSAALSHITAMDSADFEKQLSQFLYEFYHKIEDLKTTWNSFTRRALELRDSISKSNQRT